MNKIYKQVVCFAIALIALTYTNPINAQVIFTIAGNGISDTSSGGVSATTVPLLTPYAVVSDAAGNVYIADRGAQVVKKIDLSGIITIFAGTLDVAGSTGDGGAATAATLNAPQGLAVDASGNVYISENGGTGRVRKVDLFGNISTFATTLMAGAAGMCFDGSGNLYVACFGAASMRVMKVTPGGVASVYAGAGGAGHTGDGGPATAAQLHRPISVAMDASGNLYIATFSNNVIRKVDAGGIITTFCGTSLTPGFSGDGGPASAALLNRPQSVAYDATVNKLYIGDVLNNRIRQVDLATNIISTFAGTGSVAPYADPEPATAANINFSPNPANLFVDPSGKIYFNQGARARVIVPCTSGLPVVSPSSGPANICEAAAATVVNTTPGGIWSSANPSVGSVDASGMVTGVSGGTTTINYTVWNGCGFTTVGHPVTIDPLPSVSAISGAPDVCVASMITLSSSTPGGTWASTNGNAAVGSTGDVTGVTAGVDTIMYSVTNFCGTTTVSAEVTVNPLPFAGTLSGPTAVCVGSTITLTPSVGSGSWSASNPNATVSAGFVTGVTAGVDTIEYTVANMCGTATATHQVTVTLTPYVTPISGSPVICIGLTETYTNATPSGTWSSSGTGTIPGMTPGDFVGVSTGPDVISYSVTEPCGTTTVTYPITIDAPPMVGAISGPPDVCEAATITLTNPTPGGFWNVVTPMSTVLSVTGSGVVSGLSAGTDTIAYSVFNTCGSATTYHYVTVNPLPDSGIISGPVNVCVASTITLTETVSGGTWTVDNTTASITGGGVVSGLVAGTNIAYYTVVNMCGTATASFPFTVVPLPDAGIITGPSVVCEASTMVLIDTVLGGVWGTIDTNASVSTSGVVSGVYPGLDTITYSYTNMCGTDVAAFPVSVNPLPRAGTITGATQVCVGATATVADTAAGGTWSFVGSLATVDGTTGVMTGVAVGVDTVMYSVTNSCGTDIVKRPVTVNDVPAVLPIFGPDEVCVGSTITMANATTGGTWARSNSSVNINTSGVVSGVSVGSVTISYTKTNICGSTSALKTVNVLTTPVAGTLSGPDTICINEFNPFYSTEPGGWWTTGGTVALVDTTGVVVGHHVGIATVTYTVANICGFDTAMRTVVVMADTFCHPVGISPVAANDVLLRVFPNPSSGSFTFLMTSTIDEQVDVVITNVLGETVKVFTTTTNRQTEVAFGMPAGIYLMSANTAHGRRTARVVVE
ncbi:MAG: surface protein [Flavipsychrobacter sp.]|nr:surface protein [Flavipsychrobacter sp.]